MQRCYRVVDPGMGVHYAMDKATFWFDKESAVCHAEKLWRAGGKMGKPKIELVEIQVIELLPEFISTICNG